MADTYTPLSPQKKRRAKDEDKDNAVASSNSPPLTTKTLPPLLSRLATIYTGLQHALTHALASSAVSPESDTGVMRNVLTHITLANYDGLAMQVTVDDIRRLCWLWEWDAKSIPDASSTPDDNPFLDDDDNDAPPPKDWKRGAMGIVLTAATHVDKSQAKRVPAYGIGIEVDVDSDKAGPEGMAAVARWTSASESRRCQFTQKLDRWAHLHKDRPSIPNVPLADLPKLLSSPKTSSFTKSILATKKTSSPFSSPKKSSSTSPTKHFAIPFPTTPRTPRTSLTSSSDPSSLPSTPVHQRGEHAVTAPETPSSSRRQALYERVRQKSLTKSPSKLRSLDGRNAAPVFAWSPVWGGRKRLDVRCSLDRCQTQALLLRVNDALFQPSEVQSSIIKSSPVPISVADAKESLDMLMKLCPFFLRPLKLAQMTGWRCQLHRLQRFRQESSSSPSKLKSPGDPLRGRPIAPPSPGSRKTKEDINEQLMTRSPKSVKIEAGGLREVREVIRREIELQE
ncbi:hypothetical protein DL96DRAFT_1707513 [Flagelloscypha sp. PMI_526]|nr:hypothetical protein DL96DRAFT_1707513 [Flagelloscypha sp. PMI_526]